MQITVDAFSPLAERNADAGSDRYKHHHPPDIELNEQELCTLRGNCDAHFRANSNSDFINSTDLIDPLLCSDHLRYSTLIAAAAETLARHYRLEIGS